ncbi:NAD-dependent epimerase/dehydratase family protein [Mesorhizobium sp. M1169]|uniref:NAD-dependent epimerase/dehydratase family protein n=1 Tax=Mesorhizobium sp. M1169 TaxID=2957066 RepID=UPI00333D5632
MANATNAIERNEEPEIAVRLSVSNPLRPQHAFAEWLGRLQLRRPGLENEPITISGSSSQSRSFCYVDDLIDGLTRLMNEEATSTKPQSWQHYRGSNSRTGPPYHFSRRISQGSNSSPCQRTSRQRCPRYRPPRGRARQLLYCSPQVQGEARQTTAYFDARRHPCCCARCAASPWPTPSCHCQLWHVAPQAAEARALLRISARRVKIAFSSACGVIPKWRLVAARPLRPRFSRLTRRAAPRQTGGTTHAPRETNPGNSRGPRIRRLDGAGCRPERLKARARIPHQALKLENPG